MDALMPPPVAALFGTDALELERALRGPDGAATLAAYDHRLLSLEQRLRRALAKGLPPQDYHRGVVLQEGVIVARKLLRLVQQLPPTQ